MIQMQLADNSYVVVYGMITIMDNILKIAVKDIDQSTGYLKELQVKRINSINYDIAASGIYN